MTFSRLHSHTPIRRFANLASAGFIALCANSLLLLLLLTSLFCALLHSLDNRF